MRSLTVYAEQAKKAAKKIPWIYKAAAQSYIDNKFPRHIFLETTAKCNLTCEYCPREQINDHMDFQLFKSVIDEARHYGPRSFSLHLFGEPLLWPHILEGIEYIKQAHKDNVVMLTTNGTHLNRFVDDLIKLRVNEIIWSWRTEAKFRPETKEKLLRATKKGSTKFRVRLIKEVTPKKAYEEWKTWPKVEVRHLHDYGGDIDIKKWGAPDPPKKRWPCYHIYYAPAVAWNGNFLLCCADPHSKEIVGNVKNRSITKLWQSSVIKNYRKNHEKGIYAGPCQTCDVWKSYPSIHFPWQTN